MKSKMLRALVFAVAIIANTLHAETHPSTFNLLGNAEVKVSSFSKTLTVDMTNLENETVSLTIQDAYGYEVFSEKVEVKNILRRKYDLKLLEKGSYELIIRKHNAKLTQAFEVDLTKINIISPTVEEKMHKSVFQKKELIDVNILLEKEMPIFIQLKNDYGVTVFEENYQSAHLLKRYNLKLLPKGKYYVELTVGDGETEKWNIEL